LTSNLSLSIVFASFSWNLQHFGAGSCHFNGFVSLLNPTLFSIEFGAFCSAMFSIHAVVVSLAGCVGLGVDFYQRMLVCCFVVALLLLFLFLLLLFLLFF
jgi:hypothetical protein